MSDIIERLRARYDWNKPMDDLCHEGAAEIERLRAERADLKTEVEQLRSYRPLTEGYQPLPTAAPGAAHSTPPTGGSSVGRPTKNALCAENGALRAEIERLKDEIDRRRWRAQEFLDELAKWRAGYDVLQKSYLEISKIVGRQGNEEQSLADQVRQLLVERDELLAALDALTSLKTLTTPRSNADLVLGPDPLEDKMRKDRK